MNKTILVVDDFRGTLEIIQKALERKGYTTLLASNGTEALEYLDGRTIHLLITDYEMPGMNGPELVRKLRERTGYEFLPVIILSASPSKGKEELLSSLNIGSWIQKPFDVRKFYEIIERFLKRS